MLGDLWTSGTLINIIELPRDGTHDISWKVVFKALEDAIPMVFNSAQTDFLMYYVEGIMKIAIRQLKGRAMYPPVMDFIIRILLYSKEHKMNWESFSLISLGRALDFIKNPCLKSYKDFWRLCSLWSALSPNSFEQKNWSEFICSVPEVHEEASSHVHKEFPQGTRFDNMLKGLGLLWAPGFIVAVKFGAENMNEADLMKYVGGLGEEKFLENVVRSISLLVKRTAGLYHIRDLHRFIVAAILFTTKLLKRVRRLSKEINKDYLYKECVKFCNFVHKSVIPDSIISSLCGYIRALFSLVEDYNLLKKFFDTLEENEDYDNAFLLEELCLYISKCPKEKVPAMSQRTIEMLISSDGKNIRRAAKGLFAAQNIATTYKVAEAWAREVGAYKNAEVYHAIVSQLPSNLATFELIVNNIGYAKVGLLCTKLEKVLVRILKRISGSTEREKLEALYEAVVSNTNPSRFTRLKAALQEAIGGTGDISETLLSIPPKGEESTTAQTYDKEKLGSYIMRQIELRMNDNIDIVSSLFELGDTHFQEALFSGKLDSIITTFVKNRGDAKVNDMACNYVVKILGDLENAEDESRSWEKSILVCSLIDVLDKELLMYVTYDQFIKFLGHTTHSFVQRWRDSSSKMYSPPATLYDFYIIMRATIFALFDYKNVTLEDPNIAKLVGGIYDAYSYVVLPQDLQAASVITRCLSQETDEKSIAEGKLHAFLAAQITGGFADLDEFGKSFVKTLVSLEFTLARKFTGILFPLPDSSATSEADTDIKSMRRMMRTQDLSIYRMCQLHESPELTLRVALNFITTAGVNSAHEFYWVHKGLCSMLSDTSHDLISDELKCLALRGATSLIVNACIHDTREERIRHILDPEIYSNKRGYGLHRAKMINESIPLEEIIAMAHEEYTEVLSKPEDVQSRSRSASLSPQMSPQGIVPKDEVAMEMDLKRQGARSLNDLIESFFNSEYEREGELVTKFGYDQLPLSEINKKRTFHWKGLNISVAISNFMYILESILGVDALISQEEDPQLSDLQCEAVHSLVTLSDVLVPAQSMWLLDVCTQLFDLVYGTTTDFLLMRNLVIGVLKSAAQTNSTSAHVVNAINRVICHSLVSEHMTVKSGVLIGVRFLVQASNRDVFLPDYLVTIVMNHINETLYTVQPENTLLHVLSAGFDLIQYFPRQSEEFGFTNSFTSGAAAICRDPKSSSNVVKHIYKGFRMLLLCDTIDQNKRIQIEEFALRMLKQDAVHSNLSIGLLFTSMYARKDAFSLYASKRRGPMTDELGKFQEIFAYIKHQTSDWELQASSPKLVDILGQMMGDLLTPEAGLRAVLRELSGSTERSRRIFARVMHKLMSMAEDKNTVFDAIKEALTNFGREADGVWLATCTLLSVSSDDKLMNNLFNIVLYGESNKELLQIAGMEALRRLNSDNVDDLKIIFNLHYDIKF